MASTINGTSTGSGGLISTGDDSGILNIQTNETTAITVDASQKVSFSGAVQTATLNSSTGVLATQNGMTGIAKAWVNYNGVAQTISGSYNVSSVTVNATGDYRVNFTTAMPNANYATTASASVYTNNPDFKTMVALGDTSNAYGQYSTAGVGLIVTSIANNVKVSPYILNCIVMSS